jgi:hypothetical protein
MLASRKVVWDDSWTEGSETAKACTDEQEGLTQKYASSQSGAYEAYLSG